MGLNLESPFAVGRVGSLSVNPKNSKSEIIKTTGTHVLLFKLSLGIVQAGTLASAIWPPPFAAKNKEMWGKGRDVLRGYIS